MQRQRGFTLIEMMIVVAIVIILSNIAIPSYQKYIQRAKYTELLTQIAPAKTAIELCMQLGELEINHLDTCLSGVTPAADSGIEMRIQPQGDSFWLMTYYLDAEKSGPLNAIASGQIPNNFQQGPDAFVAAFQIKDSHLNWKQGCLGEHAQACPKKNTLTMPNS